MPREKIAYLIRHPHTQAVAGVPSARWELSERGKTELESLMSHSLWDVAIHTYTSSEQKASSVGEMALKQRQIPTTAHDELGELNRPWTGGRTNYNEIVASAFQTPDQAQDGWESVRSGFNRVKTFLTQTAANERTPAAIVSHGLVLSAVRADILGQDKVRIEDWQSLPFASVATVDLTNWKLLSDFESS